MAEDAADPVPQFAFKKRGGKAKATFRKKLVTPPPASDSDFTSSDDDEGHRIKRRRKNAAVTASSTSNARIPAEDQPTGAGPAPLTTSNDATKSSNWYDEEDLSAKNLLGATRARPTPSTSSTMPDGTYKGTANYQSFIQKNPDAPSKQFGPIKASTNVRTITVMDYAPDVCKDYKKTGCTSQFHPLSLLAIPHTNHFQSAVLATVASTCMHVRTTRMGGSWIANGTTKPRASS